MEKPLFTVAVPRTITRSARAALLIPVLLYPAAARAQSPAAGSAAGQARPAQASVRSKVDNDLRRITFKTVAGELVLTLPDRIAPGDTISGTLTRTSSGGSDVERGRNAATLGGYSLELASLPPTRVDPYREQIVFTLPGAAPGSAGSDTSAVPIVVRDPNAQEIGRTALPLAARGTSPTDTPFILPPSGIEGRTLTIRGRFDGDAATTRAAIADQDAVVVAESPRLAVVQTPRKALGRTQITLQEGTAAPVRGDFDHQRYRRDRTDSVVGGVLLVGIGIFAYLMSQLGDMFDGFKGFGP